MADYGSNDFLRNLASGLRVAAGTLSTDAFRENNRQDELAQARQDALKAQQYEQRNIRLKQLSQEVLDGSTSPQSGKSKAMAEGLDPSMIPDAPSSSAVSAHSEAAKRDQESQLAQDALGRSSTLRQAYEGINQMQGAKYQDESGAMVDIKPEQIAAATKHAEVAFGTPAEQAAALKPAVEHPITEMNYPVDDTHVQPHISLDGGKTFNPIPGAPLHKTPAGIKIDIEAAQDPSKEDAASQEGYAVAAFRKLYFNEDIKGMGNEATKQRKYVQKLAAQLGKRLGKSPMDQAMIPHDNKAKYKAIDALTKWGAFVDKSSINLQKDLDVAADYADKLGSTAAKRLNEAIISGKSAFGSGDAQAYALAVQKIKSEYMRLQTGPTSNAMLSVDAEKTADRLISTGITGENWRGEIKNVILREAKNTRDSVDQTNEMFHSSITETSAAPSTAPVGAPAGGAGGHTDPLGLR